MGHSAPSASPVRVAQKAADFHEAERTFEYRSIQRVSRCIPGHIRSALPLNAIPRQPRTSHEAVQQTTKVLDSVATCNPKVWNFPEAEVPLGCGV
jgi:hypothetical protein